MPLEMSTLLTQDRQQRCQSTERVLLPVSRLRYAVYVADYCSRYKTCSVTWLSVILKWSLIQLRQWKL